MIGVTGKRSNITQEFLKLINEEVVFNSVEQLPLDCKKYLLCAGVLHGKSATEITEEEAWESFRVNFFSIVRFCDNLFEVNKEARVCIIGSQSGAKGSYDTIYAGAKSALHLYTETKRLSHQNQQLVAIAPTIIEDTNMTQSRADLKSVQDRGQERRMRRWLTSAEVARTAKFVLDEPALSNTVIHITGGNW